jgi:hypothetical protein
MKVTLESTSKIVELQLPGGGIVPARIWEGHTDTGISLHCYITRVAIGPEQDQTQFEAELLECRAATPAIAAIPARLIL